MDLNADHQEYRYVGPASPSPRYVIRVQGHLDLHWSEWLAGMAITHEADGKSRLEGLIVDQAALHGVLSKLFGLCVPIVTLEYLEAADAVIPSSPIVSEKET